MWNKIKATLGLNKAELAAQAEAIATAAREKRVAAQSKRTEAKAAKAEKAKTKVLSPKDEETAKGQPWVQVLSMDVDPTNPGIGSFELDWNDIFVARLIKSGYQGKTDQDIVDNWFQDVCRNVVLETYQQEQADPDNRPSNRKDLGDGRVEIS